MVGVNGLMADQYEAKTPHRIELCEKALSRPTRNYGKRRIMTGVQTENTTLHPKPEMTKIETRSKPLKINNCISTKSNGRSARSRVTRKVSRTDEYHKVTDYFNTVKDVPKSPPPSTVEKPANLEPTITNGKCTYKLDSTISNRRNSQANITQYFPVRRSERKTSKLMLAEKMRDLEKAIREQREDGLEVAEFKGKGRGVIATRAFRRGEFVAEYAGELVGVQEARERETRYAEDPKAGCYMYYFRLQEQSYCVDATAESGRVGRLVNHSRTGNLLTKAVWVDGPRLVLLAAHDIAPGEELTYDYGDRSKESLRHHPWLAL